MAPVFCMILMFGTNSNLLGNSSDRYQIFSDFLVEY